MAELILKVDDSVAERFKEVSLQKFQGNDTLALKCALEILLSDSDKETLFLEQIVEQIQDEIEAGGSMTAKEIEACIAGYRHKKNSRGNGLESGN